MVQHLKETSGTHFNSVSDNHHGTPQNGVDQSAEGQIDGADDFDGSDDVLDLGSDSSIDDIFSGGGTVSAWIFPEGWGEDGFGRIMDKANDTGASQGWSFQVDNGNVTESIRFESGFSILDGSWHCSTNSIELDDWQHVTVVYNSDSLVNDPIIYINGDPCSLTQQVVPLGSYQSDATYGLSVGNFSGDTTRTFNGIIDEVHISKIARPEPWIKAQYLSMSGNFITYIEEDENCF
ncbi:MAG: LamG domain-containing protein [Proteobacteria bacterium]|nr:LamG domain-containing protein [Pseudomonadota bacterium]